MPDQPPPDLHADLAEARDRSIATLRRAADHRRVKQLTNNIHARLQGETQADAVLAIVRTLGIWLRSMPTDEQVTGIAMFIRLLAEEIDPPDA